MRLARVSPTGQGIRVSLSRWGTVFPAYRYTSSSILMRQDGTCVVLVSVAGASARTHACIMIST
eukprot:6262885-Prymnesium_polylepis.1